MKPAAHFFLFLTGIVLAVALGVACNTAGARVYLPYYFTVFPNLGPDAVTFPTVLAQGIFEGLLFGLVFSVIFVAFVARIGSLRCGYGRGLGMLCGITGLAVVFWGLGGLVGWSLATLSPEWFAQTFPVARRVAELSDMPRFAWVGGSIWGLQFGAGVALIFVLIYYYASTRNAARVES